MRKSQNADEYLVARAHFQSPKKNGKTYYAPESAWLRLAMYCSKEASLRASSSQFSIFETRIAALMRHTGRESNVLHGMHIGIMGEPAVLFWLHPKGQPNRLQLSACASGRLALITNYNHPPS